MKHKYTCQYWVNSMGYVSFCGAEATHAEWEDGGRGRKTKFTPLCGKHKPSKAELKGGWEGSVRGIEWAVKNWQ